MATSRYERPGELDELRRLNEALAGLYEQRPGPMATDRERAAYTTRRAQLRQARSVEVRRLRSLPVAPWSHGQLANVLGVSRASIQQWENPALDRRRPSGVPPAAGAAWVTVAAANLTGGYGLKHAVCHFCAQALRHLVG